MWSLLLACVSPPVEAVPAPSDVPTTLPDSGPDTTETAGLPYSGGTCPVLQEGVNAGFRSGEAERKFRVILPPEPEGAGVIFAWHWLGGSSRQIVEYMGLDVWAQDLGFIVIAPDASGDEDYEWAFLDGPEDNPDALFFDDMRACAAATWGVDLDRIHAMGMSAGGVWTTWLTFYRSDVLATTAPLSGGTSVYTSPERPIPVLLTWGGPTDIYEGYSFDEASRTMSEGLQGDGHFVVECVHDGGHSIPPEATDYLGRFFVDHPAGVAPEPYTDGLPAAFPDWCSVPG